MTIHGSGYRGSSYRPTSGVRRVWAVAREEARLLFRTRLGVVIYGICQLPLMIGVVILMLAMGVIEIGGGVTPSRILRPGTLLDPASHAFFLDARLKTTGFLTFVVLTCLVSCRAIAKDRAAGALEIYWTRGITPLGYFLGKWAGSFLLLASVFVVGPALQWGAGIWFAPDGSYLDRTLPFVPRALAGLTVLSALGSLMAVTFSALAGTPGLATVAWLVLLLGTEAVSRLLARLFGDVWHFKALAPWDALKRVVEWITGVQPLQDYPVETAAAGLGITLLVLGSGLVRRLRFEVVG